MKLVLKVVGTLLATAFLALYCYCVFYNVFRLQFSMRDSFLFAFVQVPMMILTFFGVVLAYKMWTAIVVSILAAGVGIIIQLRKTHSN